MTESSGQERFDRYVQFNHVEPAGSLYAVSNGDMHIRNGHPVYRIEPFPLLARPVADGEAGLRPSVLLAAEHRVVEFSGRETELAALTEWRDAEQPGISTLLLHGPGGQGKTRLAARFAELSSPAWTVWCAHHLSDPSGLAVAAPGDSGEASLLVVDYAERWPADGLQLLLGNPVLRRARRTRVLLVARSASSWWPAVRHRMGKSGVMVHRTLQLGPLAGDLAGRERLFTAARDAFAGRRLFGLSNVDSIGPPAGLGKDDYLQVLTIHMAALAAVDAPVGPGTRPLAERPRPRPRDHPAEDHGPDRLPGDSGRSPVPYRSRAVARRGRTG
jgi:hypothetical protein